MGLLVALATLALLVGLVVAAAAALAQRITEWQVAPVAYLVAAVVLVVLAMPHRVVAQVVPVVLVLAAADQLGEPRATPAALLAAAVAVGQAL